MVFSRSYVLLRLDKTNLISLCSKRLRFSTCSASRINEKQNDTEIREETDAAKRIELVSTGYLKRPTSELKNISSDVSVSKFSGPEQVNNVVLWDKNVQRFDDALEDIPVQLPGPLDICTEDISHVGPHFAPTFTYAKYANESETLKQLVKLGVELYKLEEKKDVMEMFLRMDFEKDIKPYIQFLYDCGVPPSDYGKFITKNPKFFEEDMDDLHTRIRYLRAHDFSKAAIQSIVSRNPFWLSIKTKDIDSRLGYFQNNFKLKGYEVRFLAAKCPKLITYKMQHIRENTFAVREEMGFNWDETKLILMKKPHIWIKNRERVVNVFDYAHNEMKLPHKLLSMQPQVLLCRKSRLVQRHKFLVELKRNQYDPSKPMYLSPTSIIEGDDLEFCRNVAKCHHETYNMFLKTL